MHFIQFDKLLIRYFILHEIRATGIYQVSHVINKSTHLSFLKDFTTVLIFLTIIPKHNKEYTVRGL